MTWTLPAASFSAARRSAGPEFLDDARLSRAELAAILRELARFNGAMFGHWPVLSWLKRATRDVPKGHSLTLLDVGCGYGDLLRAIRRWAARRGIAMKLIGIDMSADVVAVAREATPDGGIDYRVGDVFAFDAGEPVDLIVSSLVAHHMTDAMIENFLRWMETTARCGWFICDLQRSLVPYYFIAVSGWLMRVHPVVINDGRISVARALTREEWNARFAAAGLARDAVDTRWFMFRFGIGRLK
jgi:2-polyprenyl-3-methyl-5-hydroxy-6-metoxy-1,4-benzoquinol methylase